MALPLSTAYPTPEMLISRCLAISVSDRPSSRTVQKQRRLLVANSGDTLLFLACIHRTTKIKNIIPATGPGCGLHQIAAHGGGWGFFCQQLLYLAVGQHFPQAVGEKQQPPAAPASDRLSQSRGGQVPIRFPSNSAGGGCAHPVHPPTGPTDSLSPETDRCLFSP